MTDPRYGKPGNVAESDEATTPEGVLQRLRDPATPIGELREAVFGAEVLTFSGLERTEIRARLRDFVLQHRDSNVPQDLVAVGSAIRKLVSYLPSEDLGSLAELLKPGVRVSIPLEVELEIAKTVVRKLTADPPVGDDCEPELAERLLEIVQTYLNVRLLPREKYGATALNAALSLMLLRSRHVPEVIRLMRQADVAWFTQLACRRVARIVADLHRRVPDPQFTTVSRSLTEFSQSFCEQNE